MENISGNKVVQKIVANFFWQKDFLSIWMCTFRIWSLEAAIMQAKVRLSHKKIYIV